MNLREVKEELRTLMLKAYRNAEVAEGLDKITPDSSPWIYRSRAMAFREALALVKSLDSEVKEK